MARLNDFKAVEERLQQCLVAYPGVLAAYVFGSVAAERTHANSDVDIAVLVDDDVMKSNALRYRLKLLADLSAALGRPDVDLAWRDEIGSRSGNSREPRLRQVLTEGFLDQA